ncbi:MAG TPA: hemolysin family protein [Tepidiformaceae bacterium]|jgi:putative hemolysin
MDLSQPIAIGTIGLASAVLGVVAAAETALERASEARIQAYAAHGDRRARRIAENVERPRDFLGPLTAARVFAAALVVAMFAYLGARDLGALRGVVGIGFLGGVYVAFLEMTVGLLAARKPEETALQLSSLVRATAMVFAAPAFVLSLPSRVVARSLSAVAPASKTDILALVEREEAAGGVEEQERRMIRGVIDLEDKTAREIMVPRIDIAAAEVDQGVADVVAIVNERGFSRIPAYRETIDDIVGIAYAKDMLRAVTSGGKLTTLDGLLREPMFIPESKRLDELLTEMRAARTHMAIVVDEYGGTAGLVTIEDLLEEIVGEIEDEYDVSGPTVDIISEDEAVLDAGVSTDMLNELFQVSVESDDFDTIGGFVIESLGRLPSVGDEVKIDGLQISVLSMAGRRIRRVRVARVSESPESEPEPAS